MQQTYCVKRTSMNAALVGHIFWSLISPNKCFQCLNPFWRTIWLMKKTPSQFFWLFDAFNQSENIFDAYSLTFKVTFDPKARVFGLYGKNWSIFGHFWAQNKILGHFSKFWQIFDQIWSILPDFCPNSNFHWNFKEAPCTWYVHFFWSNAK